MDSDDDANLVARVLAGDRSAFGILIDRHHAGALAFARRLVSRADAEDVVQDALIAAFLAMGNLRAPERFKSWLLGIVINLCRTRLRLRREGYFDDRYGGRAISGFRLEDAAPSAEFIHEARELHHMISEAVSALPNEMQETVRLHYVEGLKLSEIAVLIEVPLGTVKARIHRARERLRIALASEIGLATNREPKGGDSMIEVTVDDVVVRSPKNEEAKWLADGKDYKLGFTRVILLKERSGNRVLPIWVGAGEGDIIAMLLAITALGGSNATKTMLNANIQASDTYGYYQAKNIRQTVYQLTAEQLDSELLAMPEMPAAARTKIEDRIKRYRERVDRYESDPSTGDGKKELLAKAKEFEARRDHAAERDPNFDFAEALFQIAIVLGSVSIVAASRPLVHLSGILAVAGTLLMINGYFLLVHLPFE